MARAYLTYLQEPYLIGEVRSYARSLKAQQVAPRKIYAGDLGLRHVAALTFDEDIGRLEETAVFHALEMRKQDLFYFEQQSGEVDFLRPLSWFHAHAYHRRLAGCRDSPANKKSATMGMAS
jgi:predicted AAA+ superfamily ATPase